MARSFNGTSDHIHLTPQFVPRQTPLPFSVGAWVLQNSRGSVGSSVIGCGLGGVGGWALDVGSGTDSTKLSFVKLGVVEITSGLTVPTGRWVFVGAVVLSTKVHFVMVDNGVLSTNDVANSSALVNTTGGSFDVIGAARNADGTINANYYWNGRMQDVFFIGRQLGDEEWRALGMGQSVSTIPMDHHWALTGRDNCEPEREARFSYGTLVGTTPAPFVAPRGGPYRSRSWRDQVLPLLRGIASTAVPVSDADTAAMSESSATIAATVTGSDSATETEGTPTIALSAADTAALTSETGNVVSSTPTAKSDTDSATVTDAVATANNTDFDVFRLTESGSVVSSTPTAKSDSDSATESETGVVTPSSVVPSNDTATLSETASVTVVGPTDLNDHDGAALSETYTLLVEIFASDGGTLSENDGGSPGGGNPPPVDGGGTGTGGGPGIVTKLSRRSIATIA